MRVPRRVALGVIIAGNAIPLVSFFIFNVDLHALLVVYWVEVGVIGAATAAKIRRAEGTDNPEELPNWEYSLMGSGESRTIRSLVGKPRGRVFRDFLGTYAVFWGFLVFPLFSLPDDLAGVEAASPLVVLGAAVALSVTHIVSYRVDFLEGREYEQKGPVTLLVEPFPRLYGLLGTVIFAGATITFTGSPVGLLALIVGAKTYVDVRAHRREHGYNRSGKNN
ncbi:MAG: DUF6498-containing protein [Halorubrum sp.]